MAIQEKMVNFGKSKSVIFHYGNARPHVAKQTFQKLRELKWNAYEQELQTWISNGWLIPYPEKETRATQELSAINGLCA